MKASCEQCMFYEYDDEFEEYVCDVSMDEDEVVRLMQDQSYRCPFYRSGDEYTIVRKQ